MEKIFESVVYRRLTFINETFQVYDKFNNGFISGSRTSDNLVILNRLIEKQLLMGKKLYACFIDFSKAFDLINRTILFYKLRKNGWKGKVIDTFRSLYRKTHFRVKRNGKLSPSLLSNIGVNQGGIANGLMFRKYMSDLSDYLFKEFGVVIEDVIIDVWINYNMWQLQRYDTLGWHLHGEQAGPMRASNLLNNSMRINVCEVFTLDSRRHTRNKLVMLKNAMYIITLNEKRTQTMPYGGYSLA